MEGYDILTNLADIVDAMKQIGIKFDTGLSEAELDKIESIYGFVFPDFLQALYRIALPISENTQEFPRWNDFSEKNIIALKDRIAAPYGWLAHDIEAGFRLPTWKGTVDEIFQDAPLLIPIRGHRYIPAIDHPDPPVLSTVGRDTVWYGENLYQYLKKELLADSSLDEHLVPYVPLWSDLIMGDYMTEHIQTAHKH